MVLYKYWLIVSRATLYKFQSDRSEGFWEWLYRRIVDVESADYARPMFVMYLLGDAIDKGEFVRATDIYDRFESIVDQYSNSELIEQIESARTAARNRAKLTSKES